MNKDNINSPSRVLHFNNVTPEISQADLVGLCNKYGEVTNVVMLKSKNQALIEFRNINSAMDFVSNYTQYHPTIRGIVVYPSYSQHQELRSQNQSSYSSYSSNTSSFGGNFRQNDSPASPVLLVTILNPMYPISVDVLGQIFHRYDSNKTVEKILIFKSKVTGSLQALIKFSRIENAAFAMESLQGKNIYTGCCTLNIQFSNNTDITIKENSDLAFDFTNPNQPKRVVNNNYSNYNNNNNIYSSSSSNRSLIGNNDNFSFYSGGGRFGERGGNTYGMNYDRDYGNQYGGGRGGGGIGNDRSVIIVSGFPPDKIGCDHLFHLFSNYGLIIRIKILNQKPNTALIQFENNQQSNLAVTYLSKIRMFGSEIDVNFSKHSFIRPPIPASEGGDGKTVDYEHSPMNRVSAYNYGDFLKKAHAPSSTLHISNLSPSTTSDTLSVHLSQAGEIVGVKLFETDSSSNKAKYMGLVQYSSVETAVEAMCLLHNSVVDGHNIRLSFTKSKI